MPRWFCPGQRICFPKAWLLQSSPQHASSWQDCFSPASEPSGAPTRRGESKQGTHYLHVRANGNSMGLKTMSLGACLETHMDGMEVWWQHLLPHVPVVRTNKGKPAEATKLQLLLSSFYSHLNLPRVSTFRTWFY